MSGISRGFDLNTTIDKKYRLETRIGMGGMGEVFEACHIEIGLPVAIKTLRPEYAGDASAISRLSQEARLAGSIGHDHICQVTDIGSHNGIPYLVMPLLKGMTLSELINSTELSVTRLVDIVCQVLSALSAAHQLKIIHRDLKPSNIFITKVGKQSDFVKLLDFGISKVLRSDNRTPTTRTGNIPGTTHYMSPEQAMGMKEIDHRVDLYAIGVILYRAITGRYPFDGDTNNEILYKISSGPFIPPRSINPNTPESFERVILKAMARDPLKRYGDANQMREVLEAIPPDELSDVVTIGDAHQGAILQTSDRFCDVKSTKSVAVYASLAKDRTFSKRLVSLALLAFLLAAIAGISGYDFYAKSAPGGSTPKAVESSVLNAPVIAPKTAAPTASALNAFSGVTGSTPMDIKVQTIVGDETTAKPKAPLGHPTTVPPLPPKKTAKQSSHKKRKHPQKPQPPRVQSELRPQPVKKIEGPLGSEISLEYEAYQ